ncbi:putative transporter [Yarrowia sp. C11]|nr:putative transporter [Yarrowia sp. E02]KAG5371845.1 putative transporter [Yarrowia sp. C11]
MLHTAPHTLFYKFRKTPAAEKNADRNMSNHDVIRALAPLIPPEECALEMVAVARRKHRQGWIKLFVSSVCGGVMQSIGAFVSITAQGNSVSGQQVGGENDWLPKVPEAAAYSIGLILITMFGLDLFNSNILFFTVGCATRKLSVWALLRSWVVSWFGNLGGALFVSYIFAYSTGLARSEGMVNASYVAVNAKLTNPTWAQLFARAVACNALVCMGIYMSFMCRTFVAKYLALLIPVFAFVYIGFDHVVADMFIISLGLFNGSPHSVGLFIHKSLVGVSVGNIVGGGVFAIVVPWYLHYFTVKALHIKDPIAGVSQDGIQIGTEVGEEDEPKEEPSSFSAGEPDSPTQAPSARVGLHAQSPV